jgi:hypothetical protein
MVTLVDLVDNGRTDKNTVHSYLPLYDSLFSRLRQKAVNVLEIGIQTGGSIKLWRDYFDNATVYAMDIIPLSSVWPLLLDDPRIKIHASTDAYDINFFNETFVKPNLKFDMLLDDGPHTLESMEFFISQFSSLLSDDGILVVEDVQSWDWLPHLEAVVPPELKQYIKIYDLRPNKGRYDDIVFTIDKNNS